MAAEKGPNGHGIQKDAGDLKGDTERQIYLTLSITGCI